MESSSIIVFWKLKLTDELLKKKKPVEFWNITNKQKKSGNEKLKDFIDNPEV